MEVIQSDRSDAPLMVVDYAHTPDALQKVLETLRSIAQARGGGRGGGGGSGTSLGDYTSCNGIGGSTIKFCGIRLGFGSNGNQFTGCCSLPYASGGGGGCSHVYSGAAAPFQGAQGTQGIVRVIEYY